jgi:hypothetical protein
LNVFVVEWGAKDPQEIHSIWSNEEAAQQKAEEMGGRWRVSPVYVHDEYFQEEE